VFDSLTNRLDKPVIDCLTDELTGRPAEMTCLFSWFTWQTENWFIFCQLVWIFGWL